MSSAIALCYEHPQATFAFVYTRAHAPIEVKRRVDRADVVMAMYGNLVGDVKVVAVNTPGNPQRQSCFVVYPMTVLSRDLLKKLVMTIFEGEEILATWKTDADEVTQALKLLLDLTDPSRKRS